MPRKIRPIEERFWEKVDKTESCWLWMGGTHNFGYGVIGVGSREQGVVRAHRWAFERFNGSIPPGKMVLHKCDVPQCVNPAHLFLGNAKDNAQDMLKKRRNKNKPFPNGENNPSAKLNGGQVREIRKRLLNGEFTRALAREFKVDPGVIRGIKTGRTWKCYE